MDGFERGAVASPALRLLHLNYSFSSSTLERSKNCALCSLWAQWSQKPSVLFKMEPKEMHEHRQLAFPVGLGFFCCFLFGVSSSPPQTERFSESVLEEALRGRGAPVIPTCRGLAKSVGSVWGGGRRLIRALRPVPNLVAGTGDAGCRRPLPQPACRTWWSEEGLAGALRAASPAPRAARGWGGQAALPGACCQERAEALGAAPRPERRQVQARGGLLSRTCCTSGKCKQLLDVNWDYPVGGPGPGPNTCALFFFSLPCAAWLY